jgi:hypothetical protein
VSSALRGRLVASLHATAATISMPATGSTCHRLVPRALCPHRPPPMSSCFSSMVTRAAIPALAVPGQSLSGQVTAVTQRPSSNQNRHGFGALQVVLFRWLAPTYSTAMSPLLMARRPPWATLPRAPDSMLRSIKLDIRGRSRTTVCRANANLPILQFRIRMGAWPASSEPTSGRDTNCVILARRRMCSLLRTSASHSRICALLASTMAIVNQNENEISTDDGGTCGGN